MAPKASAIFPPELPEEDRLAPCEPAVLAAGETYDALRVSGDQIEAKLAGLSIAQSRLDQVSWRKAQLPNLALRDVVVSASDFSNARLLGGQFRQTFGIGSKWIGADFSESNWQHVVFQKCQLSYSFWRGARLRNCRFEQCEFEEADFDQARFESVAWVDCRLRRSRFFGVRFDDVTISRCDLAEV
ncbi:MAG: pentapeptide repeat-containing protein, partial [Blastopirellula sp. JB062]